MNIHEKIIKLRAMVPERGASEEEALAALGKADKLMAEHGITEAALRKVEVARDMRVGGHAQRQKVQHPSSKWCLVGIGAFTHTKVWYDNRENQPKFFGLTHDVEMCEFLLGLVHDSMDRGWKEFLATNAKQPGVSRHTQYWSFMMGFASTINEKLKELIDAREIKVGGDGTDLVVVKMALVEDGLEATLPDLKLKRATSRGMVQDGGARAQGKIAGAAVNLSRPVKGHNARKQIA